MTLVALIRHGPTEWTEQKRIQGGTDVPLSEDGRAAVRSWRLPDAVDGFAWAASPLARARETALILGAPADLTIEARLAEMNWGAWEGKSLRALRTEMGETMAANESRGLDFRPPGGESPRDVLARLGSWLKDRAASDTPSIAVTHKGVIRAALALATGWDMTAAPPHRLSWATAHLFSLGADGVPEIKELNVNLRKAI